MTYVFCKTLPRNLHLTADFLNSFTARAVEEDGKEEGLALRPTLVSNGSRVLLATRHQQLPERVCLRRRRASRPVK